MSKQKKPYKTLRNFIISLILLVLLACILPLFLKGPGNKALITPEKIKLPQIKLLKPKPRDTRPIPAAYKGNAKKKSKTIYKWKDKHGVTHFTDYPNPDGPSQEMAALPEQTPSQDNNPPKKQIGDHPQNSDQETPSILPLPMTISPSQVKKLKEDAEKLKETLQKRYDEMTQMQEE